MSTEPPLRTIQAMIDGMMHDLPIAGRRNDQEAVPITIFAGTGNVQIMNCYIDDMANLQDLAKKLGKLSTP